MNGNRKRSRKMLKKAVMATAIAGTLATSVVYPGLSGQSDIQVVMAADDIGVGTNVISELDLSNDQDLEYNYYAVQNAPTQQEIRNRLKTQGTTMDYREVPNFNSPYAQGSLTDETLNQALVTLNNIRFIAGLPADVSLNESYNDLAQAASYVNYINNQMTHFPERPDGISDELFNLASKGASSSNLVCSSAKMDLSYLLIHSWMNDGDARNIDRVGHRRWILNPDMKQTGFGAVWGGKGMQGAVYVFDTSREDDYGKQYTGVAWPSKNMPINYFGTSFPWSYSVGENVDIENIQVTLTWTRDGKIWNFQNGSKDFYVDSMGYGQVGCIIFRPDSIGSYQAGDEFTVEITGLEENVEYTVSFFSLDDGPGSGSSTGGGSGSGGGSSTGGGSGAGGGSSTGGGSGSGSGSSTGGGSGAGGGSSTGGGSGSGGGSSAGGGSGSGGGISIPIPTPDQKPEDAEITEPDQTEPSDEKKDEQDEKEPVVRKEKGVIIVAQITGKTATVTVVSEKKRVEVPNVVIDVNGKEHKVTKLGSGAFAECSKLEKIILPAGIVSVDKKAFFGVDTKDKVIILDSSLSKKKVQKLQKKLRKAGFQGVIKQAVKQNIGKKNF